MSEESITSSVSSSLRSLGGSIKETVSGFFGARRDRKPEDDRSEAPARQPDATASKPLDEALLSKAAQEILTYTRRNQPLFDRAERYGRRAERLSGEGTSSDTARNKAERSRQEILTGFSALRAAFIDENGTGAGAAFDRESEGVIPEPTSG
ncbi:MAG: hypothetical protein ACR2KW_10200 [Rubrobacter sp.]